MNGKDLFHGTNKQLFHGTNQELKDEFLVCGTYFTEYLEIACEYGDTIYCVPEMPERMVKKDIFNEHYIATGHIPLYVCIKLIKFDAKQ